MRLGLSLVVLLAAGCAAQFENELWCVRAEANGSSILAKVNGQPGFRAIATPPEAIKQLTYRNTSVLALADSGRLYSYSTDGPSPAWVSVLPDSGFKPVSVAFARNGLVLAVGEDQYLYSLTFNGWHAVPNSCCVASVVALPDGRVVGLGGNGNIYWTPADLSGGWNLVPNSCCVTSISLDPAGGTIYGVGLAGYLWTTPAALSGGWSRLVPDTCCYSAVVETNWGVRSAIGQDRRLYLQSANASWEAEPDPKNSGFVALMTGAM